MSYLNQFETRNEFLEELFEKHYISDDSWQYLEHLTNIIMFGLINSRPDDIEGIYIGDVYSLLEEYDDKIYLDELDEDKINDFFFSFVKSHIHDSLSTNNDCNFLLKAIILPEVEDISSDGITNKYREMENVTLELNNEVLEFYTKMVTYTTLYMKDLLNNEFKLKYQLHYQEFLCKEY